ncbi:ATP-binding protein [Roseicyclus mahoneyensis]|uniref:Histidine kinase/DNA gyrase B/HSP90-like ATPase n=1 Tax=Roseicyclus mahoneyensis TaxID=164332 RepID=A0A316GP30_9RHOB|nr:ATP-binding protein [Roseicyclus mahoneyensis]PWK62644.1 histidine kinase/DNA gyrase B/HSP90-like ATPase [Roseicyclus mahoneyensis]
MTQNISTIAPFFDLPRSGVFHRFRILLIALALLVPLSAVPARAELIQSVGLMVDESAMLDFDAVTHAPFRPVGPIMRIGYTSSNIWLRLRINPAPDGGEVVVMVQPPMLDSVSFFAPTTSEPGTVPRGDHPEYRVIEPDWPSALRGYSITPPAGGADYYVRIESTGTIAADVTAIPLPAAVRLTLLTDFGQIAYLGFLLVLLLWSLRMLAFTREHLFGWFAAMQSLWLFHNIIAFGYASVFSGILDYDTLTLVYRNLVIAASLLSVAFHRAVLIRFRPAFLAVRLLDLQLAVMLIAFILFWTFDRQLALRLNAFCVAATPFILLLNAFTARAEASPGLMTMRIVYAFLSATLLTWVFAMLGFGTLIFLSFYGFMVHGLSTGILMFIILHLHVRNLIAAAKQAEAQIRAIEQERVVQQEKTHTLAQFIDMLTHETRNALAVINMSLSRPTISDRQRARVADAILGLTGVIDRCNQTIRLDSDDQAIAMEPCDLADLVQRLCDSHLERDRLRARAKGPLLVKSDPVLLGVVFSNLIDNALKYSPPESIVTVALDAGPDSVSVLVENEQGSYGCPDPLLVFDKYYRSQFAKARIGSGLGLYIVRGLLGNLGGTVTYEPTDDLVRFRVRVPC